ncbi:5-oxoprolinase subunit PxpB [uncultured Mucilaginibacter sp.]|uniref:5-oxoprolinase subunit PxpB n=1 Tax=uncultured Mucilaginibacter sp. TaxID=797541 RepID=UPI0025D9137E|nr:5-oxoprolinase subunit PxpB [uncultured Mucilaginibacter sp.]
MQTRAEPYFKIYSLSESAVTIEFGNEISEDILQRISSFNKRLLEQSLPGFYSSVPAYTTLSVFFDPSQVAASNTLTGADCFEKVSQYLTSLKDKVQDSLTVAAPMITIPVCYGGGFGMDLDEVAEIHQLTAQQVIDIHTKNVYKVYMIGFVPGFAYMGGMYEQIATPRKATPRKTIPAGSVGIAGKQTGIYPLATPGGWQIIGRTPLKMFDAGREQPSLLKAGDNVVFKAIGSEEFEYLSH